MYLYGQRAGAVRVLLPRDCLLRVFDSIVIEKAQRTEFKYLTHGSRYFVQEYHSPSMRYAFSTDRSNSLSTMQAGMKKKAYRTIGN